MKLTKSQLKQIIKEELEKIMEGSLPQKLGLGFEFTTDELILNLSAMLENPETIPQGPGEFRELEGMITNHIQKKGTPEQKEKLKEKLLEEVNEFLERPCLEELADVQEVLNAIAYGMKITADELLREMFEKSITHGIFKDKIILEWVEK